LAVNFWSVTYFGVLNFGTLYLGAKIGQNKTMTKISRFTVMVWRGPKYALWDSIPGSWLAKEEKSRLRFGGRRYCMLLNDEAWRCVKWFIGDVLKVKWQSYRAFWACFCGFLQPMLCPNRSPLRSWNYLISNLVILVLFNISLSISSKLYSFHSKNLPLFFVWLLIIIVWQFDLISTIKKSKNTLTLAITRYWTLNHRCRQVIHRWRFESEMTILSCFLSMFLWFLTANVMS
jgi:hypothetical protein